MFSIDTELIWGSFLRMTSQEFAARFGDLRTTIRRLLELLDRYEVPATWAIVGHLLLDGCRRSVDGVAHPELTRPRYDWLSGDWYAADPCTSAQEAPLWYAPELVELIKSTRTEHEIGSHSFGHIIFGDPGCPAEAARDDLRAWAAAAAGHGVAGTSMVFPRNRPAHFDVVADAGFTAYRARPPVPPDRLAARLRVAATELVGLPPEAETPRITSAGLVEIPGSMPYLLPNGRLRTVVPLRARVNKARRGVAAAARNGGTFHLWLHPMDLAVDAEARFRGLGRVLAAAQAQRERGHLDTLTMRGVADRCLAASRERSARG